MKSLFDIANILDHQCLTTQNLDHFCKSLGIAGQTTENAKANRFRLYQEFLEICGSSVHRELKRNLGTEEAFFISRRIEFFLTARGFD